MEGWVDLGALITIRPGIEPMTAWSKVRRPNRCATKTPLEQERRAIARKPRDAACFSYTQSLFDCYLIHVGKVKAVIAPA